MRTILRILFMAMLLLMAVRVQGQSPKIGFGDTMDAVYDMDPTYYTDFHFDGFFDSVPRAPYGVAPATGASGRNWYTMPGCDSIARYFYTDHPLEIAGIAVSVAYGRHWDENNYQLGRGIAMDTTPLHENLFLYDAMPGSLDFKARVPMPPDLTAPHRYISFPSDTTTAHCGGGNYMVHPVMPIYEMYFQNPVTVEDSFYAGMTVSFKLDIEGHWEPQYSVSVSYAGEVDYWPGEPECKVRSPYYRYWIVRSRADTHWEHVTEHWNYRYLLFIFPLLVPDTGCAEVENIRVAEIGGDSALLTWDRTEGHTWWEVSYGPVGVSADLGTVVECGDTTAVLEGLEYGARYWAYVRAVCEKYHDRTYYSDWSRPVEIYNINRYNVTAEANYEERGRVDGGGVYEDGDVAVLTARAWRPYIFYRWDDGVVDNPRRVVVTQDTTFTAVFTNLEGIATADSGLVQLLPNPASGSVLVMSSYGMERVEVYDTRGSRVHEQAASGTTTDFDVSGWAKGAYVVMVHTPKGIAAKRLVVQ